MDCQKHQFSLEPDVHYLNGAYMSPLLKQAEAAGVEGVTRKSRPYRVAPNDFFTQKEVLRGLFAQIVAAPSPDNIALIPSVSYGMAIVAKNLKVKKGQKIVVAETQFPSNVYPWIVLAREYELELVVVEQPKTTVNRGKIWNQHILDAIDDHTALVALEHVHWANGTIFDLETIGQKTHQHGGLFVVDGTQSVGAYPIDVKKMQIDALVCAGYKWLMGPYSMGYAYFSDYFFSGTPLEENWINRLYSEDFAQLTHYQSEYQPGARRFDVGEHSNFILVPMCIEALTQLLEWTPSGIQQYCSRLVAPFAAQWRSHGYWLEDERYRASHLFGVQLPTGMDATFLQAALKAKQVMVSVRGEFVRISPNVYNDERDMEALTDVLLSAKSVISK